MESWLVPPWQSYAVHYLLWRPPPYWLAPTSYKVGEQVCHIWGEMAYHDMPAFQYCRLYFPVVIYPMPCKSTIGLISQRCPESEVIATACEHQSQISRCQLSAAEICNLVVHLSQQTIDSTSAWQCISVVLMSNAQCFLQTGIFYNRYGPTSCCNPLC